MNLDEPSIAGKPYRFVPNRVPDPANQNKVSKTVRFDQAVYGRIHRLACKEQIPFNKALEKMLDTDEARQMAPDVVPTLIDRIKATTLGYASFNIFTRKPKTKRQKDGNTKGISRKIQG